MSDASSGDSLRFIFSRENDLQDCFGNLFRVLGIVFSPQLGVAGEELLRSESGVR